MTALLEVEDLRVAYGKIEAVKGISFKVEAGQVVTLIGTNGAGKTTTLRTLSGLLKPVGGQIIFDGKPLNKVPAHKIVALGLAHSPEGRHIFPRMTIEENLRLGAFLRKRQRRHREGHPARLRPLPHPRGTPEAGRRNPLRRRAADARHGPRPDVPAQAAHARRALHGPLADHDAEDHGDHRRTQVPRAPRSCSSSRTPRRRSRSPTTATSWRSASIVLSGTGQDLLHDESVRKAYLGED